MEQMEFRFDGSDEAGHASWVDEQQRLREAIRREWGFAIGENVRITLTSTDGSLCGRLEVAVPPTRIDRRLPLCLRIGRVPFSSLEITSCVCAGEVTPPRPDQ
ncbi:MAG: hypothetical protein KA004_13100 [Verrucomicrobiales bacterium]|nr:hypothetical protein [Verrucomicrobiales bacterium]